MDIKFLEKLFNERFDAVHRQRCDQLATNRDLEKSIGSLNLRLRDLERALVRIEAAQDRLESQLAHDALARFGVPVRGNLKISIED